MRRLGRIRTVANGLLGGSGASSRKRMLVLVDGNNLVSRYQEMVDDGAVPLQGSDINYEPKIYVWTPVIFDQNPLIDRASFYVLFSGGGHKQDEIENSIMNFKITPNDADGRKFTPHVVKKKEDKEGIGDIPSLLAEEVRQYIAGISVNIVCLFSGDGGYRSVIQEVIGCNKQVKVYAFSKGADEGLKQLAGENYHTLDELYFAH